MKCLIITNENTLKEEMKNNFPVSFFECYDVDSFNSHIKKIFDHSNTFDYAICNLKTSQDKLDSVFLAQGFLISRNIPVFSDVSLGAIEDNLQYYYHYKDSKELIDLIKNNSNVLLKEAIQRKSKLELIEKGIPVNFESFINLLNQDDYYYLKKLIDAGFDVNYSDQTGVSLLNHAVRKNKFEAVKILLDSGANINSVSKDRGYTPLMDAVWRGNLEIVKYLLMSKADVSTLSKEDETNLVIAVGANKEELVQILISFGADPDQKDSMEMSAWDYATLFKKDNLLKIMEPLHKA